MDESTPESTLAHSIDLAQEPNFVLGSLRVRPATCEVEWNGVSESLQRRVMQVLVALAQARGSVVSQNDLVMRCWRGLSVTDDAIVRCISQLRKLAARYPEAPYAIETIPGVGYRLTSSESANDGAAASSPHGRRFSIRLLVAVTAVAMLVIIGAATWLVRGPPADDHRPIRVTVQPFEALNDSENTRSMTRRIPNEVVNALGDSQVEAMLAGEQASNGAAKTSAPGLIVTGILRDDGHSMSADVRIEDGKTRAALWSNEFKRDDGRTSDFPLEVAARVADIVDGAIFARTATPPLTDDAALSALLQTTDMIRDPQPGAWAQMIDRAQSVVTRHPDFPFGHSVLAAAYAQAWEEADSPDRAQAMADAARREANLTLQLDPQDAGAYAVLSGLPPHDLRNSETILLRGIKFARHPKEPLGALYQYEGLILESVGRQREALSYQLVAQAKDQWSPFKMVRLALDYANMGNLPAATEALEKAISRWPNHPSVKDAQLYIAAFYEDPADALEIINRLGAEDPAGDNGAAAWRAFVEAKAVHPSQVSPATIQHIHEAADRGKLTRENEILMLTGLGLAKQSFETANSVLDHQGLQPRFLFTPIARNLRQDPAFVGLASRMGLIKYWRETGKRPDFCTDAARRSECSPQLQAALNH